MKKSKSNKSKTYLLPLLSEVVNFNKKYYNNILNTYIFDSENKYKNCIFVELEYIDTDDFKQYEYSLTNNEYFIDLIDSSKETIVLVFKFPEEYLYEYNCFIQGKYSLYEEDAKELILEFFTHIYHRKPDAIGFLLRIKHILYREEILKKSIEKELNVTLSDDAELSDIMSKEKETIQLNKQTLHI